MSDYRRAYCEGGTYFFTVVTYRRQPIFLDEEAIGLLKQCLKMVMALHPFTIDAIVILPEQLHCIWTLPDGDFDFSTRWKKIKAGFTRDYSPSPVSRLSQSMREKGEKGIWQRRFWEHMIRDQEDFNRHCDYIHYNPVKHGLVRSVAEWKHSSFGKFVRDGVYPPDWGGRVGEEIMRMNLD